MADHGTDQQMIAATCRTIDQALEDVESGLVQEDIALAILASECMATGLEAHHLGRLGLAAWMTEASARFATQRRAIIVAALTEVEVPDNISGLDP